MTAWFLHRQPTASYKEDLPRALGQQGLVLRCLFSSRAGHLRSLSSRLTLRAPFVAVFINY